MAQNFAEFDLAAFKDGDQTHYNIVYNLYYDPLFRESRKWVDNAEDIKDIIQDSFLKLWRKRRDYESLDHIRNALFLYTVNSIKDRFKKIVRRGGPPIQLQIISEDFNKYAAIPASDPYWEREERKRRIFEEIRLRILRAMPNDEQLSDERREVVRLYYIENRKIKDIAILLDMDAKNVSVLLSKARKAAVSEARKQLPGLMSAILWILSHLFLKK